VRVGVFEDKPNNKWGFIPPVVEVVVGTTILFVNDGKEDHNYLSLALDQQWGSEIIPPGGSYTAAATKPGEVRYICDLHPDMEGLIRVRAG
jgi:plastocyanin